MSFLSSLVLVVLTLLCSPWVQAQPSTPAEPARFDVLEYEVEGNTVLPALVVERAVLPHMGPQRSLVDVDAARAALEKAYQDAGYLTVLVDLPEQRVADGLVRLRVVEGRVDRVRVTGARYFSQGHIRAVVAAIQPGEVPDLNRAQAQLAELNRSAYRQVQPVLRPGLDPGTVDVELKVRDALPLSGSAEVHNHHAANTDPLRLAAALRYDNLLQRDHSLSLNLSTAPREPQQSQLASLGYTVPGAGASSWQVVLSYSNSTVEPLGNTVLGKGSTARLRWTGQLAGADSVHSVSLGGEFRDLQQRVRSGTDAAGEPGSEISTPLRYLPFSLGYSGQWWHAAGAAAAQSSLAANFTFGIRGLLRRTVPCPPDGSQQDQFACNREGADGGFATLRLDAGHSRPMPLALPGTLNLRLAAQLAGQPLVSGEQITAGGAGSVRGYYESEVSGDIGVQGGLQWQSRNLAAPLRASLGWPDDALRELSTLGFVDAATVRVIDPQPGQAERSHLAGAGVGLRLGAAAGTTAELDLAWPLRDTAQTTRQRVRVHARMALSF